MTKVLTTNTEQISVFDKTACVEREVRMRESVYPRWVAVGKMSDKQAKRELAVMKAILADYREFSREQQLL
jgi:hypothetical protein